MHPPRLHSRVWRQRLLVQPGSFWFSTSCSSVTLIAPVDCRQVTYMSTSAPDSLVVHRHLRVAGVWFEGIFGAPNEMTIDFTSQSNGKPVSALIFGENGSGKSSIVKAIEWASQGRIGRKPLTARSPRGESPLLSPHRIRVGLC